VFTATEKKAIAKLLSKAVNVDDALNVEELHGFLFGLATIPEPIMPSEWFPIVLGEEMAKFENVHEASEMMGNLFKVYNRLNEENNQGRLRFPFDMGSIKRGDLDRIRDWAYGLDLALTLRPDLWGFKKDEENITEEMQELSSSCGVIIGVARPELIPEVFDKEGFAPETNDKDMELQAHLFVLLPKAVAVVQDHFRVKRKEYGSRLSDKSSELKREKIGRNDPCPCGSGKKYKRCCG
jgi:uncharacterized protein